MHLKVMTPLDCLVDEAVSKIVTESSCGYFCVLPKHIDFATTIVPSLLIYTNQQGEEQVLAVDEGVLTKQGGMVRVSTQRSVRGTDLESLKVTVKEVFKEHTEREKQVRSSLAHIEANLIRNFIDVGKKHV